MSAWPVHACRRRACVRQPAASRGEVSKKTTIEALCSQLDFPNLQKMQFPVEQALQLWMVCLAAFEGQAIYRLSVGQKLPQVSRRLFSRCSTQALNILPAAGLSFVRQRLWRRVSRPIYSRSCFAYDSKSELRLGSEEPNRVASCRFDAHSGDTVLLDAGVSRRTNFAQKLEDMAVREAR